jgi:hypothetical protein
LIPTHEKDEDQPHSRCSREALDLHSSGEELALERRKWCRVGFGPSANDHVDGRDPLQDVLADDLPESSLQLVALHNGATMLRNNEAYAGMMQKGSDEPEIEILSPNTLPVS